MMERVCDGFRFYETLDVATGISRNRADAVSQNTARVIFPKRVTRLSPCARQHDESPVLFWGTQYGD